MNKVLQLHFKSSQIDFFYDEPSLAIFHRKLKTEFVVPFFFKDNSLHGPHGKHSMVVDACLQMRCLATEFLHLRTFFRHGSHRKHSFLSIVASLRAYRAVAWQRVDPIRYNIINRNIQLLKLIILVLSLFTNITFWNKHLKCFILGKYWGSGTD
jgi:hypothetical protein